MTMVDESNGDDETPDEPLSEEEGEEENVRALHDPVMREHERPRDGFEPISVWLVFIFLALVGWGGWYLGAYSAGFRADVIDIIPLADQGVLTRVDDEEPQVVDPMVLGGEIYSNCAACHQADGQGIQGTFPPLVGTERVLGDPRPFVAILLNGIQGPLEVDGVLYNNLMPAWDQFSDQEMAAVMTYVRQSWGNDAEAVEPELVAQVRDALVDRDEPWTDDELEQFDWEAIELPQDEPEEAVPEEDEPEEDVPEEDDTDEPAE